MSQAFRCIASVGGKTIETFVGRGEQGLFICGQNGVNRAPLGDYEQIIFGCETHPKTLKLKADGDKVVVNHRRIGGVMVTDVTT